jgi:hypothetical protein
MKLFSLLLLLSVVRWSMRIPIIYRLKLSAERSARFAISPLCGIVGFKTFDF